MSTLVCVPILVHEAHAALADAAAARLGGADLVEFRIDECFSGEGDEAGEAMARRLVAESPLPCIITCRTKQEGGGYDGDDMARIALYESLCVRADAPAPRYIDLEHASYSRSANLRQKVKLAVDHPEQIRDLRTSLILSTHDFAGRPNDLLRRVTSMASEPAAAVIKVAYRARSLRDNLELLDLPAQTGKPTISLGMGEFGLASRVLAPKFGGFLTFASLRPQTTTAPGQPTLSDLLNLYRFRSIKPTTKVYGVVGWPVGHSLSPLVHNAGFEAAGHDGVYIPLPIAADEGGDAEVSYLSFKATLLELLHHDRLDLAGCSVTIPHKQHLVRLAREEGWAVSAAALSVGAANTLIVGRDASGAFSGASVIDTDGPALVQCVQEAAGVLVGKRVAILGAGGVARTAAFSLAGAGATVIVYARSHAKSQTLANEVGSLFHQDIPDRPRDWGKVVAATWDSLPRACCEVLINCTPVGMTGGPAPDESPAPLEAMSACADSLTVMDTVYNPLETPLLKAARARGARVIDGASMFVRQAEAQFGAWLGRPAPEALFDLIVRERLGQ